MIIQNKLVVVFITVTKLVPSLMQFKSAFVRNFVEKRVRRKIMSSSNQLAFNLQNLYLFRLMLDLSC